MRCPWKLVSQSADLEVSEGGFADWSPRLVKCGSLEQPPPAVSAAQRLADRLRDTGLPPPPPRGAQEGEGCAGALAQLRRLSWVEIWELVEELDCRVAADCIDNHCVPRLNNMKWNMTTLQTDDLRHHILSQSVHGVRQITRATVGMVNCEWWRPVQFVDKPELQTPSAVFRERLSSYLRELAQLLSLGATHASQLLLPLAFERTFVTTARTLPSLTFTWHFPGLHEKTIAQLTLVARRQWWPPVLTSASQHSPCGTAMSQPPQLQRTRNDNEGPPVCACCVSERLC
ncbi:uncharacterized protein LOC126295038 [Schistocerca gregaria]|uniref:uncharacterized protein LOC126295038 n=1 Tax=Schistocerca gregaria TaxID=7010 RepID=UPI00211F0288|nr:uncharacterized protein LOC126295038 [Schistocerca gregaria]